MKDYFLSGGLSSLEYHGTVHEETKKHPHLVPCRCALLCKWRRKAPAPKNAAILNGGTCGRSPPRSSPLITAATSPPYRCCAMCGVTSQIPLPAAFGCFTCRKRLLFFSPSLPFTARCRSRTTASSTVVGWSSTRDSSTPKASHAHDSFECWGETRARVEKMEGREANEILVFCSVADGSLCAQEAARALCV